MTRDEIIESLLLPLSIAPRYGKYYGTEIIDSSGGVFVKVWSHTDASGPSEREKARFWQGWTPEVWAEYCCDSHWESAEDLARAEVIVSAVNSLISVEEG